MLAFEFTDKQIQALIEGKLDLSEEQIAAFAKGRVNKDFVTVLRRAFDYRIKGYIRQLAEWAQNEPKLAPLDYQSTHDQYLDFDDRFPEALDAVVTYPYVGSWANASVRDFQLLKEGAQHWQLPDALLFNLAHFGDITAAIALRAGAVTGTIIPFSVIAGVRSGLLRLPSLGAIKLGDDGSYLVRLTQNADGVLTATPQSHRGAGNPMTITVSLPADLHVAGPQWRPNYRLRSTANDVSIEIILEDIDRHAADTREGMQQTITTDSLQQWQALFDEAWLFLTTHFPHEAEMLAAYLIGIVPLIPTTAQEGRSATAHDAFGSFMLTPPENGLELARIMVHEAQHGQLGVISWNIELTTMKPGGLYYTPWRRDPRPAHATIDGCQSFAAECRFWATALRVLPVGNPHRRRAEYECARWIAPTTATANQLLQSTALTPAGRALLGALHEQLSTMEAPPIPEDMARLAALIERSNTYEWRLRNIEFLIETFKEYAELLLSGQPAKKQLPARWFVKSGDRFASEVRQDLMRAEALLRGYAQNLCAQPGQVVKDLHPGIVNGDLAFIEGHYLRAVRYYLADMLCLPESVTAWVGWALSREQITGEQLNITALELAYTLYLGLTAQGKNVPTPDRIYDWLLAAA